MMEMVATVRRFRVYGDWGIAFVDGEGCPVDRVTGAALIGAGIQEEQSYRFRGTLKRHPKHGESLEVMSVTPEVGLSSQSLVAYMARVFKGCGPKTAAKIVNWYGNPENGGHKRLHALLTDAPWKIVECPLVKGKLKGTIEATREQGAKLAAQRLFSLNLAAVPGIPVVLSLRLAEHAMSKVSVQSSSEQEEAERAWAHFARDPYGPIRELPGYSFGYADRIGLHIGIARDAPVRMGALGHFVLNDGCVQEGHTFLTQRMFRQRLQRFEPVADPLAVADEISRQKYPVVIEEERVYPGHLFDAERKVAKRVAQMLQVSAPLLAQNIDSAIAKAEATMGEGFSLSDDQRAALRGLLAAKVRLHSVTAGPGCGKTALMEVLANILGHKDIAFCAPTGKAAKVLAARVQRFGYTACTIHRLLEPSVFMGQMTFHRGVNNPLDQDIIVVDESGMVDLPLCKALFEAVPAHAHVILLGDVDQLASVGPGDMLASLLRAPADHHRLHQVHRNEGGILDVVHAVRRAQWPAQSPGADVVFYPDPGEAQAGFDDVQAAYLAALERHPIEQVALLIPRRKGSEIEPGWNTTYANARLQAIVNPNGAQIGRTRFRVGDRAIIKKNLVLGVDDTGEPDLVVNGDTGRIVGWKADESGKVPEALHIELDTGRRVTLKGDQMHAVQLGYALTVHAAQGSEYAEVIAVLRDNMPLFMNRNLLYTAVSRAKRRLVVFGSGAHLARMAQIPGAERKAFLAERIERELRMLS